MQSWSNKLVEKIAVFYLLAVHGATKLRHNFQIGILYNKCFCVFCSSSLSLYSRVLFHFRLGPVDIRIQQPAAMPVTSTAKQNLPLMSLGFILFTRQLLSSDKFKVLSLKDRDEQLLIYWNWLSEKEKNEFNVEAQKVIKLCNSCVSFQLNIIFPLYLLV